MNFDARSMPLSAHPAEPGISFSSGAMRLVEDPIKLRVTVSPVPHAAMRRGHGSRWEPFLLELRLVHLYRPLMRGRSRRRG